MFLCEHWTRVPGKSTAAGHEMWEVEFNTRHVNMTNIVIVSIQISTGVQLVIDVYSHRIGPGCHRHLL